MSLKGVGALANADGDAHRLATELRQQVDLATLDDIVFVDTPVRYGLKHYTGVTVEQVESYPGAIGPEGYVTAETLCQELATGERHLLIVPTRTLEQIQGRVARCPRTLERVGTLRKWTLLRAIPEPTPAG